MSCSVTSTWHEKNGKDFGTVLTCRKEDDEVGALPQNGATLWRGDNNKNDDKYPYLSLTVCDPASCVVITAVDILCNARHMELYTDKKDYICTEEGILVETLEDNTNLYLLQNTLEKAEKQLSVKLLSLQCKDELFVLNVQISTASEVQLPDSLKLQPCIDLQKVKEMLSEQPLSENAKHLMSVVENFQEKRGSGSHLKNMAMFMSMFPDVSPQFPGQNKVFPNQIPLAVLASQHAQSPSCAYSSESGPVKKIEALLGHTVPGPQLCTAELSHANPAQELSITALSHINCGQKLSPAALGHTNPSQELNTTALGAAAPSATQTENSDELNVHTSPTFHTSSHPERLIKDCSAQSGYNLTQKEAAIHTIEPLVSEEAAKYENISTKELNQLEVRLKSRIDETEKKIQNMMDDRLNLLEQKIISKLDKVLDKLGQRYK